MTKVETITFSDYKNLFKENKDLDWLKAFMKDYIKDVLEWKKINKIEKEEFELFELHLENIKRYKKISFIVGIVSLKNI